jgi:inosine-uridine nucleoside N-ribohydrolase
MPAPAPAPGRLPVIIDTDPGIDDMLALFLALASPELDVRGISVSYGNTVVEHAHRNAVEIVRRAGKRVRLACGARRPLRRPLAVALETHGASGLGDAELTPAGMVLDYARTLERLLAEQPEPVTLVTLGPLTGLALALRRDAALVRAKVSRHLAMVGALEVAGNTTPHSEFNAWCDPEALDIVLRAELPTEMVGLDVTRQFVLSGEEIARLGQIDAPLARWIHAALKFYLEFHRTYDKLDGCVINDVLPIAELLQPGVLSFHPLWLKVGLENGDNRGRTKAHPDGARVDVADAVQVDQVRGLLFDRVLTWLAGSLTGGSR